MRDHRAWIGRQAAEAIERLERVVKRRRVRDAGTGPNHAGIVADDVRDREAETRTGRGDGKASAFDRRQMLPHRVQRVNVRAGVHQPFGRLALVAKRQTGGGDRHQG